MQPVARFAWLTLAYNVAVIVWGAYVLWIPDVWLHLADLSGRARHHSAIHLGQEFGRFPKYAAFPPRYPELERRNVVPRLAVAGERVPEEMQDIHRPAIGDNK